MKFDDAQDLLQPDIHSSTNEYAQRFSGAIGQWFLSVQQHVTADLLGDTTSLTIIDFGGGHAQNCWLADQSSSFTVHATSDECFALLDFTQDSVKQVSGGLVDSGLADGTYNIAMSYRMLAHLDDWQGHIAELCRVSDQTVIIEFPNSKSVNALAENLFTIKKSVEGNTRKFALFQLDQVKNEFANHGFVLANHNGQYLLPMALHRALKMVGLSRLIESVAGFVLPKKRLGSPFICRFDKLQN